MSAHPLIELVDPGWAKALEPVSDEIAAMGQFLRDEIAADRSYLPPGTDVLAAFARPFDDVRVLVVGQDPYPTPGYAMGLAFSVRPDVAPIPRSLANVFRELTTDLLVPQPSTGDLSPWADQGVLLLNRVLTVEPGFPGSHRGRGWESVTACAIEALAQRDQGLVAILWGRDAASAAVLLGDTPVISSAHPSPLSASRGFFGSRPFSRANASLHEQDVEPINWRLP